jgi:hypothetical protein
MNAGATVAGVTEGAARVNAASYANYDDGAERAFLKKALMMAGALPSGQRIAPLDAALKNDYSDAAVAAFVADAPCADAASHDSAKRQERRRHHRAAGTTAEKTRHAGARRNLESPAHLW